MMISNRLRGQRANYYLDSYRQSDARSVYDVYRTCSREKVRAEREIINTMIKENGHDYRVLNGNSFSFTCGFKSKDGNTLYVFTRNYCYSINIDF